MYNTRIAPSPTGDMHIGTARTAYFNYLAARASGGSFVLRIDDTDLERSDDKHTKVILETMDYLGLEYNSIVYQSERFGEYKDIANDLLQAGMAEEYEGAIRLTTEIEQPKGPAKLIVLKSDGSPSYHFASVVDDWGMNINYIIRGVDHESNEDKHRLIWSILNGVYPNQAVDFPKLDHVGLIHKDKKKLSKRHGAASMLGYRDRNYHTEALLNFMLRMGWGPHKDDKTNNLINKEKAIHMFLTEGNMRKAPSGFDQNKLDWYNKKYYNIDKSTKVAA